MQDIPLQDLDVPAACALMERVVSLPVRLDELELESREERLPNPLEWTTDPRAAMNELLGCVPAPHRAIIIAREGLVTGQCESYTGLAQWLLVSEVRVRELHVEAVLEVYRAVRVWLASRQFAAARSRRGRLRVGVELLDTRAWLSGRLRGAGLASLADVVSRSERDVLEMDGFDPGFVAKLKAALGERGLALWPEDS